MTKEGEKIVQAIHAIANEQVGAALKLLTKDQQKTVLEGMQLYAEVLKKTYKRGLNNDNIIRH